MGMAQKFGCSWEFCLLWGFFWLITWLPFTVIPHEKIQKKYRSLWAPLWRNRKWEASLPRPLWK